MKKVLVFSTCEGMFPYYKEDTFIQEGKSFRLFNQALDLLLNKEEIRNSFSKIVSPNFGKLKNMFGPNKTKRLLDKLFQLENIGIPCLFYFDTTEYFKEENNMFEIYFDNGYGEPYKVSFARTEDEIVPAIIKWVQEVNPRYKIYYVRSHTDENGVRHYDIGSHTQFLFAEPVPCPVKDELTMNN